MTLPQETIDKIKAEAVAYANDMPFFNGSLEQGYIKGATEWTGKASGLVDVLKWIQMRTPIDEATDSAITYALAKYKEVSK